MGTINNTPFDVTFTCNPAGHPQAEEETASVNISEGVTQTLKGGAFGCFQAKADAQFPEKPGSLADIISATNSNSADMGVLALVTGILGILIGGAALIKASCCSR